MNVVDIHSHFLPASWEDLDTVYYLFLIIPPQTVKITALPGGDLDSTWVVKPEVHAEL